VDLAGVTQGCTALNDDGVFTVTDELRLALPDI